MPHVPPRALGVLIVAPLLWGCTPLDGNRGPEQTPEIQGQHASELIAFVSDREGPEALFVMRPDGSGVRRLTGDLPPVSHPSWSPDGEQIAFNAGSPTASDIYLIKLDGSGLAKITNDAGANFYPSWSPDGSRIAFSSNRDGDWDIYLMNADGSRVRNLSTHQASTTNRSGRRMVHGSGSRRPATATHSSWRWIPRPARRRRCSPSRPAA